MIWFFILQSNIFFKLSLFFYLLSFLMYIYFIILKKFKYLPTSFLWTGWLFNTLLIVYYWISFGSFPVFTLHQKLIFFTWIVILLYLILEILIKFRGLGIAFSLFSILFFLISLNFYDVRIYPPFWEENLCFAFEIITFGFLLISFFFSFLYLIFPETRELHGHWLNLKNLNFVLYLDRFINISLIMLFLTIFLKLFFIEDALWKLSLKNEIILLFTILYILSFHLRKFERWRGKRLAWVIVIGSLIIIALNFV